MDSQAGPSSPKGKGKEPIREQPTTPPRLSFGIELEFVIGEKNGKDPDHALAHLLPPVYPVGTTRYEIDKLLRSKGIPMYSGTSSGWELDSDPSVNEDATSGRPDDYSWQDYELLSPPCYATDEAFDMIRLVVYLLTKNFRCRVNETAGFHVHIGNGYDRIPLHALRNFASLWWAAEPLLTNLHPPERSLKKFATSSRRVRKTNLTQGKTAEDARQKAADCFPHHQVAARFYGRDRKLGELPEPIYIDTKPFYYVSSKNVRVEHDDVDWAAPSSEPFKRPPKLGLRIEPYEPEDVLNPGRLNIKRGPPEIPTPTPYGSSSANEAKTLPESRLPPFPRTSRFDNHRPIDIQAKGIPGRLRKTGQAWVDEHRRPRRQDGWSGVRELLSCDAHSNQVASLMTDDYLHRELNLNMMVYSNDHTLRNLKLPDDYLSKDGRQQREENSKKGNVRLFRNLEAQPRVTVEAREATGSLDGDWIVTWARIMIGLLEFSRDAAPADFLRVIGLCIHGTETRREYDVVDLLDDVGLWREARFCVDRLSRAEEAWFECVLLNSQDGAPSNMIPIGMTLSQPFNFGQFGQDEEKQRRTQASSHPWMTDEARAMLNRAKDQEAGASGIGGGESSSGNQFEIDMKKLRERVNSWQVQQPDPVAAAGGREQDITDAPRGRESLEDFPLRTRSFSCWSNPEAEDKESDSDSSE